MAHWTIRAALSLAVLIVAWASARVLDCSVLPRAESLAMWRTVRHDSVLRQVDRFFSALSKLLGSGTDRLRWRRNTLGSELALLDRWAEQDADQDADADECIAIVRDRRRGEICLISR